MHTIRTRFLLAGLMTLIICVLSSAGASAATNAPVVDSSGNSNPNGISGSYKTGDPTTTKHQCGSGDKDKVYTSINFGCKGESCLSAQPDVAYCDHEHSAIIDALFAIIRFLSYGVGLIVAGSIIVAGIQYTASQGDPKSVMAAETRIRSTLIALVIYIFSYAILNYVIPSGFFKQ